MMLVLNICEVIIMGVRLTVVAVGVAVLVVTGGCSALQPPEKYLPGQLYGNGGATACTDAAGNPIVCKVDGGVPWCPFPNDGDGF